MRQGQTLAVVKNVGCNMLLAAALWQLKFVLMVIAIVRLFLWAMYWRDIAV